MTQGQHGSSITVEVTGSGGSLHTDQQLIELETDARTPMRPWWPRCEAPRFRIIELRVRAGTEHPRANWLSQSWATPNFGVGRGVELQVEKWEALLPLTYALIRQSTRHMFLTPAVRSRVSPVAIWMRRGRR